MTVSITITTQTKRYKRSMRRRMHIEFNSFVRSSRRRMRLYGLNCSRSEEQLNNCRVLAYMADNYMQAIFHGTRIPTYGECMRWADSRNSRAGCYGLADVRPAIVENPEPANKYADVMKES